MSNKVKKIINDSIDEANSLNGKEFQINKNENKILIGENGYLDSLSYLNFMLAVEQKLNEILNKNISFIEYEFKNIKDDPFHNLKNLKNFLEKIEKEN